MSTATESETCPDVFAIQAAIDALLARRARREELSADEQGILNYLFGRPSESDRQRNEIARMAAVRDAQRCYAAAHDTCDHDGMERAASTLRHLAPAWVKSPAGHALAIEEATARRELGIKTSRRDTLPRSSPGTDLSRAVPLRGRLSK